MSRKKRKPITRLRVMAEYASSGIWSAEQCGLFRHSMIGYDRLKLPSELKDRFKAWIELYWQNLQPGFDPKPFNAEGFELAIALKRHVGSGVEVVFAPEFEDGGLEEERLIEA